MSVFNSADLREFQSEAYFKRILETLGAENKQLRHRLAKLERENKAMKKALYDYMISSNASRNDTNTSLANLEELESNLPDEAFSANDTQRAAQNSFIHFANLKGHSKAVYCSSFSPDGRLLASGSMDGSIMLWDHTNMSSGAKTLSGAHRSSVADVAWHQSMISGGILASTGYDCTAAIWDATTQAKVQAFDIHGLGQCLQWTGDMLFIGTSKGHIHVADTRIAKAVHTTIDMGYMINTISSLPNGVVISGGAGGKAHTIDSRQSFNRASCHLPVGEHAISGLAAIDTGSDGIFLACATHDDHLRTVNMGDAQHPCIHELTGHRSRNMPTKISLKKGSQYNRKSLLEDARENEDKMGAQVATMPGMNQTILSAVGSTDGSVFVYDVGGPKGFGRIFQQLEGHKERVCGTCFHPSETMLATFSADCVIKLWVPKF